MDYRNSSPGKFYTDESLQPQGPRRLKTSTPRGRRPNPYQYQRSPDFGIGGTGTGSPPSDNTWNKSWRHSNESWRSRDGSRNSSFNSSFSSPGASGKNFSPSGFKRQYHRTFRKDQEVSTGGRNIAAYYDPSMMENPWLYLEQNKNKSPPQDSIEKQQNLSTNSDTDFLASSEGDKLDGSSDQEAHSPDVLVESIYDCSYDPSRDETNSNDFSNSQKSVTE